MFEDIEQIIKRANSTSKEFVVQITAGTFEWRTLSLDHEQVKGFIANVQEGEALEFPLVNLPVWARGGEFIESDEEKDGDDDK